MTKLIRLLFIAFLFSSYAWAEIPIERLTKKEDIFVIQQTPQIQLKGRFYIYRMEKLQALGEIILCKNNRCLGKIIKKTGSFKLMSQDQISLNPKRKVTTRKVETKQDVKSETPVVVQKTEDKTPSVYGHSLSLQYGGPLTKAISANYILSKNNLSYYAGLGMMSGTVSDVDVSGFGLTVGASYGYYQHGDLHLLGKILLDAYATSLDFTSSRVTMSEDVMLFNMQLLQTFEYRFSNSLSAGLDIGFAINTLEQDYNNSLGDQLSISFSGGLIQSNLFLRYFF